MTSEPIDQETEREYPSLLVHFDPQTLNDKAVSHVFGSLLVLNMKSAVDAIMGHGNSEGTENGEAEIIVTVLDEEEGGPMLEFSINSIAFFDVRVDPTKFDRTNKAHEKLFERCAQLVKALRDSQYGASGDYHHPRTGAFQFWCCKDGEDAAQSSAEWASVAEAWGVV